MADIALDDQIKKDKEKSKLKHLTNKLKSQKHNKPNKFSQNENPKFQGGPLNKHKPIQKKFNNKNRPPWQDNRQPRQEKQDRFNNRPPRQQRQETEDKEKMFRTLKVMGLSPEFTNEDLYKLFATEGALEKCLIEQDNFGRSLTTALVKYHNPDHARSAITNLNRHKIMNCVLTVEPYKNIKK